MAQCDTDGVSLESSWVLDIRLTARNFAVQLEMALLPDHPIYSGVVPGEAHCYRRGWLIYEGVREFHFERGIDEPVLDPDGTEDWGNLYTSTASDGRLHLETNLGTISLACSGPISTRFDDALDAPPSTI